MKTLIVYATKYGCTQKCVEFLKPLLKGDVSVITKNIDRTKLDQYDYIIVGGSVYMGSIQKVIKNFLKHSEKILLKKKLGLFLCCYTPANTEGFLPTIFPQELIEHASYCTSFGGIMDYDKMNFFYRKLFQSLKKIDGFNKGFQEPHIDENEIKKFASIMNS